MVLKNRSKYVRNKKESHFLYCFCFCYLNAFFSIIRKQIFILCIQRKSRNIVFIPLNYVVSHFCKWFATSNSACGTIFRILRNNSTKKPTRDTNYTAFWCCLLDLENPESETQEIWQFCLMKELSWKDSRVFLCIINSFYNKA